MRVTEKVIKVEIDGVTYQGRLFMEGTRRLTFYVLFQGKRLQDTSTYPPGREGAIEAVAKHIIWEEVTGRRLG